MGKFVSYYSRLFCQAFKDFVRFGSTQMIGVLLAVAILLFQIHYGVVPPKLTLQSAESLLWPYATLAAVMVLFYLLQAPVKLDSQRSATIAERDATISELNSRIMDLQPKRTPSEEHYYNIGKAALSDLADPKADVVLRYLFTHGSFTCSWAHGSPQSIRASSALPKSMTVTEIKAWLDKCAAKELVTPKSTFKPNPSGGSVPMEEIVYEIAPGMQKALEELLFWSS